MMAVRKPVLQYPEAEADSSPAPRFQTVGPPTQLYPTCRGPAPRLSPKLWNRRRAQTRWLKRNYPEAFWGNTVFVGYLKEGLERYQYAEETINRKPLLAVGSMVDLSNKKHHGALPLLAVVTGRFGEGLRLARIQKSRWGWEDDQDVALHLDVVKPEMREEESLWKSNMLPITQVKAVSFLTPNKRYRWLLVLKSNSVTILEPQYHAVPVEGGLMDDLKRPQLSFVKPNPLYTLDSSRTGGNAHSDVSLNPCGPQGHPLLVIMDECGYWTTWNILGNSHVDKSTIRLTPYQCGHMMHGVLDMLPADPAYPAETHGVLHLHFEPSRPEDQKPHLRHLDLNMPSRYIMMWNAHDWDVLDLENNVGLPKTQPKPELVLRERGRPDRILDVQRSSVNKAHLFVLTSRRLIWLKFVESDRARKSNIILHVAHIQKENEDMRLSVARAREDDRDTSLVLTYSSKNKQLCVYWFGFSGKERQPEWKRHVAVFPGPMAMSTGSEIQQLQVEAVKLVKTRERKSAGPGSKYLENGVDFYQVNMLGGNLDVWLCVSAASRDPGLKISLPTPRVEWSEQQQQRLIKRRRTDFFKHMADSFVVPDAVDDKCTSVVFIPKPPGENYRDSTSPEPPRLFMPAFTNEQRKWILEKFLFWADCRIPVAEVEAVNDALRNGQLAGWLPLTTWADIVDGLPEPIPDAANEDGIDEAVERLLELCDDKTFVTQLERQEGKAISTPSLSFLTAEQHLFRFSTVEQELSELFVTPWAPEQTQEELQDRVNWVRDVARDMFLAGHGVLVQDSGGASDVLVPPDDAPIIDSQIITFQIIVEIAIFQIKVA
ncbi:hypothetical protein CDD80_6450 [Ophiocordyceps camponoti-rufipedis]|uniref:RRN6 beta-propeller domain-containing protein n=1 Tax=Ophiocordyceps camponoti-rufipedis TaxID=2004952 RepID=A0A2C5XEV3_9HYPO|nr:hypothetical protein CDD80_6450 [Ophiocordyceps camponoti-rufipedis]